MDASKIDIYFCHVPSTRQDALFRNYLARACLERWRHERSGRLVLVQPEGSAPLVSDVELVTPAPLARFHCHRFAPDLNRERWFVVADDDCLPLGPSFVDRALAIGEAHPEYGVLAASNIAGGPAAPSQGDVIRSHAVGGISLVSPRCPRLLLDVPNANQADLARYEIVRAAGLAEGYFRTVRMNHLGEGFSTTSSPYWYVP